VNRRAFVLSAAAAAGVTSIPRGFAAPSGGGPGFHLGCITYNTMKDLDLESIIRLLETVGYEGVELRTGHKHGVEPSISQEERAKVRRRFEQSKIRLVSYGTTCRFQSPDAAERKK
jgi:sugar phosphate isomerase/epimerase